jgi:uncharacterized 2Fe-2S/4Fe-4S cluster protein (DUF4445 family)
MDKKIFTIEIEPIGKRIELDEPKNGLEAIIDAGIGLKAVCGGKGTCGKCRIAILDDAAGPPNAQELKTLTREEVSRGVRLACQQTFDRNIGIYIPSSSLTEEQKLQVAGDESQMQVNPVFGKYFVKIKPPSLSDMQADFSRIKDAVMHANQDDIDADIKNIDYNVLKYMPEIMRKNAWSATITVRCGEIIMVEGADTSREAYGIAIDLGTTKIAVLLVNLLTGETVAKKGVMNPQISFGEDVMSRINFAMQSQENAQKINAVVIEQINKSTEELAAETNISVEQIIEMTIVGNTAMHHLLLGLPVRQLGLSPFVALTDIPHNIKARDMGIKITQGGYVYLLPSIAGFVGSDHMAMILASGIDDMEGNYLGIDIGTNTEIILKSDKGLESVSTASGPAFEGAHIRFGMRAAPGAIERVAIDPGSCKPRIQTINDKKPVGICGSGILDAVAEMLKAGIISTRGRFVADSGCLCLDDKGKQQYLLEPCGHEEKHCKKDDIRLQAQKDSQEVELLTCMEGRISINQNDIVEIQLAKSAIRTGIDILLESAGIGFEDIDRVIIAGAFGSYIDPRNVVNIGMFPDVSLKKISQVGNAAAVGAKMVLVSSVLRKKAEDIALRSKYLELTVFSTFADYFARNTLFPEASEIV